MFLKTILVFSVFFILIVSFVSADDDATATTTAPVLVPRPIPKEESDRFVAEVNKRRRAFAKERNIPNMHELTWSQQLADKIDDGVPRERLHKMNFHYENEYIDYLTKIDNDIAKIKTRGKYAHQYFHDSIIGFLLPVHREIGCAETVWHDRYNKYCYLTPGALIGFNGLQEILYQVEQVIENQGEPGTQCYEGYGNNDGLCSLLISTTPTPKSKPTQRPTLVPGKQTSEEKDPDSGGSEDVKESEESGSSTLISFYSVIMCIFLAQIGALF